MVKKLKRGIMAAVLGRMAASAVDERSYMAKGNIRNRTGGVAAAA